MLDIYEMHIFLAAADTGSFSEAGRRLQMSQPAVSMQIRSLEQRLNVELFHRSGRHIRLTAVGQALVPMARDLVNHAIEVEQSIGALQGGITGDFRIACSTTAGKYILPRLIAGFVEENPSVSPTCQIVTRGDAVNLLLENKVHVAVTSLREPSKELQYRHFASDSVILVAAPDHEWAQRPHITVDELQNGQFIRREVTSGTQQTVIQMLSEYNMSLNDLPTVMVLGNSEAIRLAAGDGLGVGFVSRRAAQEGLDAGQVVEIPIADVEMSQDLFMVRRSERAMSGVQAAFWDYVFSPENRLLPEQTSQELVKL